MFRKITGFGIVLSLLMLIGGEWIRLSPIDFGEFTALYKSFPQTMPIVVTGELLLINCFFWLLFALYLRLNPKVILSSQPQSRLFVQVALVVLFIQVLLGDWTTANHAALACRGFPQCNGTWLPALNYENALNLFYGLQNHYSGTVAYDAQITLAWLHRAGALLCFVILSGITFQATSAPSKTLRKAGLWLSGLLFLQISLSILTVKFNLPWWMAVIHATLAVLLMLPLIAIHFYSKYDFPSLPETEVETTVLPVGETAADSLYGRLKSQLQRTRNGLGGVFSTLSLSKTINDDLLGEIEANLLMADVGVEATSAIISKLNERVTRSELKDSAALEAILKEELLEILRPCSINLTIPKQDKPFVILVVGVNGAGKTTTIGKLANRLKMQGHSVMLAAGDTFRAAAVEQLQTWGERNHIHVVAQHTGADSASVIFDAIQSAQAKGIDVLIADTAGRLQTKSNLMDELKKVKRIMAKLDDTAPHEVLLVLDAGTGQNAVSQTKLFNEAVTLTGLTLTKLDGTAKGGVIFALAKQFGVPIRFIGIGESIDDLQDFDAEKFVNALFIKD
ncbi:MAG: signal recognition particle-docking protein FtsY [Methylococcales bacterium]|nr:signal recognition particle-docking protein FtsY [Methylococcales bacterium]MDD5754487.1 signal recognition particle-docking protein FtsY [Methylococcales bacterium]